MKNSNQIFAIFSIIGALSLFGCAVSGPIQSAATGKSGFDGAAYPPARVPWSLMQPNEQREFGIPLKPIRFTSIAVRPVYVQLIDA